MDHFIDKITHKFSGQDVIKANAEAEAHEMRKLKTQAEQTQKTLAQYDLYMQEMRKLNLRNTESAQAVKALIDDAGKVLETIKNTFDSAEKDAATGEMITEITGKIAELEKIVTDQGTVLSDIHNATKNNQEAMSSYQNIHDELQNDLEEAVHKENVKVYRNVQAVIMEEVGKQNETLATDYKQLKGANKAILILVIISLVVGLGNLGVLIAQMFGLL
jgi:vacuolar-type H+-ATPase subunit I/STV1